MLLETFLSSRVPFCTSINEYGILLLTGPKNVETRLDGWVPGTKWRRHLQWLQDVCRIHVMDPLNVRPVLRFTFWIRFTLPPVMIKSKTSLQTPIYLLQCFLSHLINRDNLFLPSSTSLHPPPIYFIPSPSPKLCRAPHSDSHPSRFISSRSPQESEVKLSLQFYILGTRYSIKN